MNNPIFNIYINMKTCKICKIEKDLELFYKRMDSKDGYRSECKECLIKRSTEYSEKNKDKRKLIMSRYYLNNTEYILTKSDIYRELNKEKNKITRYKNRSKRQENHLNRMSMDIIYKLSETIRHSIRSSITKSGYSQNTRTYKILGCSYIDFKIYIESKFDSWMNWDNYGRYNGKLNHGWDYDHS